MPQFASAYVSIHGKVFVGNDDLYEALAEKHPETCKWNSDTGDYDDNTTFQERREMFEELAMSKLSELFPTDTPMKVGEISIDMDSYKS